MSQYYEKPTPYAQAGGFGPPVQKERGCLFYGCLIAVIIAVLTVVAVGVAGYMGYRFVAKMVTENTEPTPIDLPETEMPEEELKALTDRWEGFRTALKDDQPTEEIDLTADDINALISQNPDLKGRVHVDIQGDKIQAKLSIPVDFLGPPGKGRFFNAEGELKASLDDENLVVKLVSAKIKGKELDSNFMASIQGQNLAKDMGNSKENRAFIAKFDQIKVKDGKVIIIPRKKTGSAKEDETKKVDEPAEAKKELEPSEPPAEKAKPEVEKAKPEVEKAPIPPTVEDTPKVAA